MSCSRVNFCFRFTVRMTLNRALSAVADVALVRSTAHTQETNSSNAPRLLHRPNIHTTINHHKNKPCHPSHSKNSCHFARIGESSYPPHFRDSFKENPSTMIQRSSSTTENVLSSASVSSRWCFKHALRITALYIMLTIQNAPVCESFSITSPIVRDSRPPFRLSVRKPYDPRHRPSSGVSPSSEPHKQQQPHPRKSSSSQWAVAGASYAPSPSSSSRRRRPSFEERMREALFRNEASRKLSRQQQQQRSSATSSSCVLSPEKEHTASVTTAHPPNMVAIESLSEYKRVVGEESERIVAVRFHASYCRACRAVTPAFYKLAWTNPNVVFVDVPLTESTAVIHQGLRVPSLPFAHIYYPKAGLVEESKLLRKDVPSFQERLNHYVQGYCPFRSTEEEEEGA